MGLFLHAAPRFCVNGFVDAQIMLQRGQLLRRWLRKVFVFDDEAGDFAEECGVLPHVVCVHSLCNPPTIPDGVELTAQNAQFSLPVPKVFLQGLRRCQFSHHVMSVS